MAKNRALIAPAIVVGLVLIAVAVIYFVNTAHALPSFFPGHVSATSKEAAHHHTKHGIAALVVGLGFLVLAWFQTGPRREAGPAEPA